MKLKIFNFNSSFDIKRILEKPIRSKVDSNRLLIKTISSIINETSENIIDKNNDFDISICVDKMSRIFYYTYNKVFSICFPFYITKEKDTDKIVIKDNICNIRIDLNVANILNILFDDLHIFEKGFEDIYFELEEKLQIIYDDFNLSKYMYPIDDIWLLVTNILKSEPGYLRYDYDEKNANGGIHPLMHIDVYFSDQNTFKIGLEQYIDILEILDNNKERFYLKTKT